jgi:hypothetical protein
LECLDQEKSGNPGIDTKFIVRVNQSELQWRTTRQGLCPRAREGQANIFLKSFVKNVAKRT